MKRAMTFATISAARFATIVAMRDPRLRRVSSPSAFAPGDTPAPDEDSESVTETETAVRPQAACKVVLFNDEEHTYDYVVEMLSHACKLSRENAFRCAVEVDLTGRTIVHYGAREACEGCVARIAEYGPDHRLPQSMTSMRAEVEEC